MTVTGVDMNRDGIPDFLRQPQNGSAPQGFAFPVQECETQPSQPTPYIQLRREPSIWAGYGMFLVTFP